MLAPDPSSCPAPLLLCRGTSTNALGGHALLFNCFDIYGEFKTPTGTAPAPVVQTGGGAYPMGVPSRVPDYGGRQQRQPQGMSPPSPPWLGGKLSASH